ncbi:MAG TPA: hypothetical protein VMU83_19105 [Hanamia sp.]|nr:hypothetical protein [Hanamia sp.]
MFRRFLFLVLIFFLALFINSCSHKIQPSGTPSVTHLNGISSLSEKNEQISIERKEVAQKPKATFPKVITVNDKAASKSVDGRLYYDVMGHRYWKNYKDGKYYLFNKSMFGNPDFKKPK